MAQPAFFGQQQQRVPLQLPERLNSDGSTPGDYIVQFRPGQLVP
jgi:hypothetical protein